MSHLLTLSRRSLLIGAPALSLAAGRLHAAGTSGDSLLTPRIIGNPKAKILVQEWFSLTCTHCAHFATEVFPQVREKLIDTGKIRYQFHDFPLDQVGLVAAMVARSLPAERYLPFIATLFSRQMQWAFDPSGDPLERLRQLSALAGVSSAQFDHIRNDKVFAETLYNQTQHDGKTYDIQGTPYFRFNATPYTQDPESYDKFAELVAKAA